MSWIKIQVPQPINNSRRNRNRLKPINNVAQFKSAKSFYLSRGRSKLQHKTNKLEFKTNTKVRLLPLIEIIKIQLELWYFIKKTLHELLINQRITIAWIKLIIFLLKRLLKKIWFELKIFPLIAPPSTTYYSKALDLLICVIWKIFNLTQNIYRFPLLDHQLILHCQTILLGLLLALNPPSLNLQVFD